MDLPMAGMRTPDSVAKLDGIKAVVVIAVLLVCGSVFAQPMQKQIGTPNIAGIKPSVAQAPTQAKTYDVPFVATAEKADGSGSVDIVTYQKVTEQQLNQIVKNGEAQVINIQKTVDSAKAQLDQITKIKAEAATSVTQ
jgi:hypothetical protein